MKSSTVGPSRWISSEPVSPCHVPRTIPDASAQFNRSVHSRAISRETSGRAHPCFRTVCFVRQSRAGLANGTRTPSRLDFLDQLACFLVLDTASGLEQIDNELVRNSHHHVAIQVALSKVPDGLGPAGRDERLGAATGSRLRLSLLTHRPAGRCLSEIATSHRESRLNHTAMPPEATIRDRGPPRENCKARRPM